MINIVVTSKPVDGLLHYSYEYCCLLNDNGVPASVVIITRGSYEPQHYLDCLTKKYTYVKNVFINDYMPDPDDVSLILGRSMLSLPYKERNHCSPDQLLILHLLFNNKLISVYSENDVVNYPLALEYFGTKHTVDLCDWDVYPNGTGEHFEKTINFSIYKDPIPDNQFEHLFLGTNKEYYSTVEKVVDLYPNYGILSYDEHYINRSLNNIWAPTDNLLGKFNTYVYTKSTFDPAPRLFQECKYYNKKVIYHRDKSIRDGGSIYWERQLKHPDIKPIIDAYNNIM